MFHWPQESWSDSSWPVFSPLIQTIVSLCLSHFCTGCSCCHPSQYFIAKPLKLWFKKKKKSEWSPWSYMLFLMEYLLNIHIYSIWMPSFNKEVHVHRSTYTSRNMLYNHVIVTIVCYLILGIKIILTGNKPWLNEVIYMLLMLINLNSV